MSKPFRAPCFVAAIFKIQSKNRRLQRIRLRLVLCSASFTPSCEEHLPPTRSRMNAHRVNGPVVGNDNGLAKARRGRRVSNESYRATTTGVGVSRAGVRAPNQ